MFFKSKHVTAHDTYEKCSSDPVAPLLKEQGGNAPSFSCSPASLALRFAKVDRGTWGVQLARRW